MTARQRNGALAAILFSFASATVSAQLARPADWLILQSASDPLVLTGSDAARRAPGARVMASSDCTEMRAGLYVLARPASVPGTRPAGAYVKRCTPRVGSLVARGLPAVDPSFAAMRDAPVNFEGADIVSSIRSGLLLRPYYVIDREDPREGLRTAVDDVAGGRRPIERDCTDPEVARSRTHLAIACAVEQVAGQNVYRTTVYRAADLKRLHAVARCRKPALDPRALRCVGQAVSKNGEVRSAAIRSVSL